MAASSLAEPLLRFFQHYLDRMLVPAMWMQGIFTPIHKGESCADPANYRPVAILPVLSKVMETAIADALISHLERSKFIVQEQRGFRHNRSCATSLLLVGSSWTQCVDSGVGDDAVFLDFSKAFDRLDHSLLVHSFRATESVTINWVG